VSLGAARAGGAGAVALGARRRLLGLLLGSFAIFVSHLALNLTERMQPGPSLPIVAALFSDSLPFLIWMVVAYPVLVGLIPRATGSESARDESARPEDGSAREEDGPET